MEELHQCIGYLITILGFCLQLEFANASALVTDSSSCILMKLFVIEVSAYFGSLGVMILRTDHRNTDFGEFMNNISILFGSLAVTLELLILLPPFGWVVLFFWSICFVRIATKSYQYLKTLYETAVSALVLAFGELKEQLITTIGHLIESNAVLELVQAINKFKEKLIAMNCSAFAEIVQAFYKLKELIIMIRSNAVATLGGAFDTEHEAQDQDQIFNELPV